MLSLALSSNTADVYRGQIAVERVNSAAGVQPVTRAGRVSSEGITSESLIQNGAVRATAKIRYDGEDEFLVRFRVWIDEFSGHSIVGRVPNATGEATDRVLVLWRDPDGVWWDIRRSQLGGPSTGGVANRFTLEDGRNINPLTILLDRNTALQHAYTDLYIVVLDHAQPHPERAGFVITYYAEAPDRFAGHFHAYEILVSTSTALAVNPAP